MEDIGTGFGIYNQPTKIGRVFLFIGGLGMLFAPLTLFIDKHSGPDDAPMHCEWIAENVPGQEMTAVGCPADFRERQ